MFKGNKTQVSIAVVGALLLVDFVWFGYLPSRKQLTVIEQLKERQLGVVEAARTQRSQYDDLQRELEQLEATIAEMGRRIPKEKSIGSFLSGITALMNRHGLTDQTIVPGVESEDALSIHVPVSVHCEGQLEELYGFFEDLNGLERLVQVDEIYLKNDAGLAGHLRMEARFFIFYQPDPVWERESQASAL